MSRLPESIDPWRAAEQGRRLEGAVDPADLPRVLDLLADAAGGVHYELEFYRDPQRRHCVRGRVWGHLWLVCQRCLEPVEVEIDSHLQLALVRGEEEAARLPEDYDPLPVSEEALPPLDLVEDEVILALPQIPLHPEGSPCGGPVPEALQPPAERSVPVRTDNPFQVLGQLKKSLH